MKNRIIKNNIYILIASIFILFLISVILINQNNIKNNQKQLINYTRIINNQYNGSNEKKIIDDLKQIDANIRITFINKDGTSRFDSFEVTDENYLLKPEIKTLGTIHVRNSNALNKEMMYYALRDINGDFIRISIPLSRVMSLFNNFIVVYILISFLVIILMSYVVKKTTDISMKPLVKAVKKLGEITGSSSINFVSNEVESITSEVEVIKEKIEDYVNLIKLEKDKFKFIIENMQQGLILINNDRNISLINQYACNVLNLENDKIIDKDFIYLTRNEKILKSLELTISNKETFSFDIPINNNIYLFKIIGIDSNWLTKSNTKKGALIIINDVTKIRNLDNSKRDFFANASHELKTPLTSIIGFIEMIIQNVVTDEVEIKQILNTSLQEAKKSTNLINDMLNLAKLENTTIEHVKENLNLKHIILDIITGLHPQYQNKNIEINYDLEDIKYYANKEHMIELFRNLIDNAIKYNKENGNVDITLKKNNDKVIFTIQDTGLGIPLVEQNKIFERFYRVDKSRTKKINGIGLGLAIVKHICILYNIQIDLVSELNKGSKFTLTI